MSDASWQNDIRRLLEIFDGENNLDAAFGAIDLVVSQGFAENFYNTLDDQDQVWKPRKDDLPHPLLIKTGKMFKAATNPADPGHLFVREGDTIQIGVRSEVVFYAWFHHVGTSRMVSRRFAYANETTIQRAMDAFGDAISQIIVSM